MLPPAKARQYSISSSPLWNAARCTLTVAIVDAPALSGQGRYQGMASSYLANCSPGTRVAGGGALVERPFPSTGLARDADGDGLRGHRPCAVPRLPAGARGAGGVRPEGRPALLFYGCDHPDVDFLYRDELAAWEAAGVVSVRPAFFKQPDGDVMFVQHRVWKDRADLARLFQQGAHVYVCGDGRRMAPAVRETFVRIYQDAVGVTSEAAEAWVDRIERETGRYVSDVFA
jgi:cytochrome P450/NADPH-cytochrome P450 reductase